jgi:ferredoxin-NADP reductase
MPAREVVCKIVEKIWVTPTVMAIRFEPSKKFRFEPGQFLSIVVPRAEGKPLRRAYSFAGAPEEGFRLCVKWVQGGPGTEYLRGLKIGDSFKAFAPYGDFLFEPRPHRSVCFVSTGTGVAPFIAMVNSEAYRENPPEHAMSVFGCRSEEEILYSQLFEKAGVKAVVALSQPKGPWNGFKGRVTDYLASLPNDWAWHTTDFYICGNGEMAEQVKKVLKARGVPDTAVHAEVYFVAPDRVKKAG